MLRIEKGLKNLTTEIFEAVPEGGDAYLMRYIIHDWEDHEAIAILKVCRRAMQEPAKVLLIDRNVASPNELPIRRGSALARLARRAC